VRALLEGLGLGASLIIAIGAQNAFVLRQGLAHEHVLPVVVVCAACDVALIAVGIAGLGTIIAFAQRSGRERSTRRQTTGSPVLCGRRCCSRLA
jgi:arginine exporter protein ArgO